ncbi:MAG: GNAT family N-acetyltransferase [Treponema sp.]
MNRILEKTKHTDPLAAKNLRKTKPRKKILAVLSNHPDRAFSVEELHDICGTALQIDLSTVYRTMHTLTELSLVTKSVHPDGKAYFQLASAQGEKHHHRIVCTRCNASADIPVCPLHSIEKEIRTETGFEITAHSIELTGICPACKAQAENCTIRPAALTDLEAVERLIKAVKAKMKADGNPQWNGDYPARTNFIKDIEEQSMYIAEIYGDIAGIVTLNDDEYAGYGSVVWESRKPYKILHRLAVAPQWQGKKIAQQLMNYIESESKRTGLHAIRSDTFSMNTAMQRFFEKLGYKRTGSIYMRGKPEPFYCFEKIL